MTKRNLKLGQVISFTWNDPTGVEGWHEPAGAKSATRVKAIAIVVGSYEDSLVITTSWDAQRGAAIDPLTIPWSAIDRLKVINAKYL